MRAWLAQILVINTTVWTGREGVGRRGESGRFCLAVLGWPSHGFIG